MIKALLLDADGVVQYPVPGWLAGFRELGGSDEFVADIFQAENLPVAGASDLAEELTAVIRRHGLSITASDLIEHWQRIVVDTHMVTLIARVREAGVITALATNQHSYRGRFMQENLGYDRWFDRSFYSYALKLRKPDPAYFQHILDELGLQADEAVFVDDLARNVRGARSIGLPSVHFASTNTYGDLRLKLRAVGVPGV